MKNKGLKAMMLKAMMNGLKNYNVETNWNHNELMELMELSRMQGNSKLKSKLRTR